MQKINEVANTNKKRLFRRLTNVSLLIVGITMLFSGLYIQICYHIQEGDISVFNQWTFVHKWSALFFTLIVIAHVYLHLKWYKSVIKKRLLKKKGATLILSVSMLVVSLLGFAPWILSATSSNLELRNTLIEIHDKIGVIFTMIMIGHMIKRYKWYLKMP